MKPSLEEIPIMEKELENSGTAEEAVVDVGLEAADGTARDEGQFVTNIWKQDNCLENDIFEKIKENEEVVEVEVEVVNNIDITKEAAAIVVVADGAAKFAGHNGQFVKNISQQVNCLEDDLFQEMEENEKFVEDTNGMKVRSNIKNVQYSK